MTPATRKVMAWVAGLSLMAVGVVGLFLPFLQGVILILAGLAVLSSHSRWARAVLQRLRGWGRVLRDRFARPRGKRRTGGRYHAGDRAQDAEDQDP